MGISQWDMNQWLMSNLAEVAINDGNWIELD